MEKIIEIEKLNKSYGSVHAVRDLSFYVNKGELFAFLGENGAGKSTTINIMCGQIPKDGGLVKMCGESLENGSNDIKRRLGAVFQSSVLDANLTVYDNLKSRAALYGIRGDNFGKRLCELAEIMDFGKLLKRPLGKLSGGQRRKADIARALFHRPEILILDEPTTGLDPQTRRTIWNVIGELRRTENLTVFLTTHYMEEAAEADRIVILDGGSVVAEGTPVELKNRYSGDCVKIYNTDEEKIKKLKMPYERNGEAFCIGVPDTAAARELIIAYPDVFEDFEITKGKMDDVFLAVTGKKLTGGSEK